MSQRPLTQVEQDDIVQACLDQYRTIHHLPASMCNRFMSEFSAMLRGHLAQVQIYPKGIPALREAIVRKYRLVDPAKSVGIICGQSIGEMQTQTTLNTFHKTGLTEKLVVAGVPRFLEIIDTNRSETQGTPSAFIFFREPAPQTVVATRALIGSSLVYFTLEKLVVQRESLCDPEADATSTFFLRYTLNLEQLFRYKITLEAIAARLRLHCPTFTIQCSALHEGQICIWPMRAMASVCELDDQVHPAIIQLPLCGIDRVQNIFLSRSTDGEWTVETDGSNLEEILNLPYVDSYRSYSNDIWEIYALFGIEAVRAYIVEELVQLMPSIHVSHITLLADRMTVSGKLRSISRYTRKHENSSVLSKATFEETLSGFLRSAMLNEVDTVNGSSASIICGRIPKVGTGMNDLMLDA